MFWKLFCTEKYRWMIWWWGPLKKHFDFQLVLISSTWFINHLAIRNKANTINHKKKIWSKLFLSSISILLLHTVKDLKLWQLINDTITTCIFSIFKIFILLPISYVATRQESYFNLVVILKTITSYQVTFQTSFKIW